MDENTTTIDIIELYGGYFHDSDMGAFMVERNLKGISMEALAGAQAAAITQSKTVPATYLRSTFVPEDGRCFCLFEGPNGDAVKQVNDAAGLPYTSITPALDLPRPA